jgi:GEVED domain/Secretion system C-terminal sorting domain
MKKIIPLIHGVALLTSFNFSVNGQTYCTSKGINTSHGYIKKVSIETIDNTSGNNGGYADFTTQSATLLKGATYTIELTPGFNPLAYVEYWTVYIDFNHNGIFEPNEIVGEKHAYIRVNKSFPIPLSALNGATRMRIQMQAGAQETNPCATYTYGEVEDYSVVITSTIAGSVGTSPDFKNITKENNTDFMLYPVPAKGNLTVEFTSISDDNVKLNVYNLSGQKLMTIESPSIRGLNTFKLNTNRLIPGFYFLEVYNNGQRQHQKFLIAR